MRTNTHSLCCNVDAPVGHNLRCSRLEATTLSFYMLSLGRPTEHFKHLRQPVRLHHARTPMTSTINGACLLSGSLPYIYADSLVPNCECRPGNLPSVMARRVYPPESSPVPFRIKNHDISESSTLQSNSRKHVYISMYFPLLLNFPNLLAFPHVMNFRLCAHLRINLHVRI